MLLAASRRAAGARRRGRAGCSCRAAGAAAGSRAAGWRRRGFGRGACCNGWRSEHSAGPMVDPALPLPAGRTWHMRQQAARFAFNGGGWRGACAAVQAIGHLSAPVTRINDLLYTKKGRKQADRLPLLAALEHAVAGSLRLFGLPSDDPTATLQVARCCRTQCWVSCRQVVMLACQAIAYAHGYDTIWHALHAQELRDMALKRAGLTEADVVQKIQERATARQVPVCTSLPGSWAKGPCSKALLQALFVELYTRGTHGEHVCFAVAGEGLWGGRRSQGTLGGSRHPDHGQPRRHHLAAGRAPGGRLNQTTSMS